MFVSRQMGHSSPDITLRVYSHLWGAAEHAGKASAAARQRLRRVELTFGVDIAA